MILLQGFNWTSHKSGNHYFKLKDTLGHMKNVGVNKIWLPPVSKSRDPEGYNPLEYYDFHSEYGVESELRDFVKYAKHNEIGSIADIVCWSCFGDYCRPHYDFSKRKRTVDDPMLFQEFENYCKYLTQDMHFDGFRFDYIKADPAKSLGKHIANSGYFDDNFIVGELWDAMNYDNSYLEYNQDSHRKEIVNYMDECKGIHMFDFTTKGILQEAIAKREYWRLRDCSSQPPGVAGWWPEKSITFLDNHDTLGQFHWPFSHNDNDIIAGYMYLFTHPGNPCIYFDHFEHYYETFVSLSKIRNDMQPKEVEILVANDYHYFACINDSYYVLMGDEYRVPESKLIFEYGNSKIFEKNTH
jgi:alpha-amylase